MLEPFIGSIVLFCGNFAPKGWALCNGQLIAISQNAALFSILGTTYGGDGVRTFALPDLRGRVPIHPGQGPGLSPYDLGQVGGSENTTLTVSNLPAHNHLINTRLKDAGKEYPGPLHFIGASTQELNYSDLTPPNSNLHPQSMSMTGQNIPINNLQPYLGINFIIALQGVFPSRN